MDGQGYLSVEEVRRDLRSLYRGDPEANSRLGLREPLADEIKPIDEKGRWKPNPMLVLVLVLLCVLAGVFLYFSMGGRP